MPRRLLAFGAVLALTVAGLHAQWLNYPDPGIPRLPDGKPNLSGPTPRTADGKPNLSGVWQRAAGRVYLDGVEIPLQPWAAALVKQRTADDGKDDPTSKCLPWGVPRIGAFSVQKIFQSSREVVFLYEYLTTFRQVFTDGRALPKDPNPTWMGYSTGRWDGDTLVIETAGFNGQSWLDVHGYPVTDAMHVTEKLRRRDFGHMDVEVRLDDPKAYTKPWSATINLELMPDAELIEYVCNENEKDREHIVGP